MTWHNEQTDEGQDIVYDGMEKGVAPSPLKGTANLQNVNISTETGEVMASYDRIKQSQTALASQTMTPSGATLLVAPTTLLAGQWIKVTASTVTGITAATNPTTVATDYLVVAGGGGGGASRDTSDAGAGGGGAGAFRTGSTSLSVGVVPITVGAGGTGGVDTSTPGTNGSDSILGSVVTAVGGGYGGNGINSTSYRNGANGGSGGGGGGDSTAGGTGGAGTTGGNNGGAGRSTAIRAGGGGGGSGAVGTAVTISGTGGAGGGGTASSITGTATTYAGGGGGGGSVLNGAGGVGGGGAGSFSGAGSAGTANTGGGGGGACDPSTNVVKAGGAGGSGVIIVAYTTGTAFCTGGTVTYTTTKTVHTFTSSGVFEVVSVNPGGYYFVSYADGTGNIKLSSAFDPYSLAPITTHGTTGSITFSTVTTVGSPIAKATEKYGTTTDVAYRYYILDSAGYVWVYDTQVYASTLAASGVGTKWMLPDYLVNTFPYTGMGVLNGFLFCLNNRQIYLKPTVNLGQSFVQMTDGQLTNPFPIHNNFVLTGHQGKLHYCDGNYIGEIFPTTSFLTSVANIQSYGTYTASSTTGTISVLLGGSTPWTLNASGTVQRIPAVFFTSPAGTLPTALTQNTVYYIQYNVLTYTFAVYAAITGGSALDIATGATGTQYYNTFWPIGTDASDSGTHPTLQFTPQRVDLPFTEEAQCLVEIGNTVLIGCTGNTVYPWNQVDATPSDLIALPESNVVKMVNVNNMAYMFAGNKGNIYITNGSVASLVLSVPDYCAGVPGTLLTYIEPYFTWGDVAYLRGRVYFSILDQTSTKAGNCGGVWSFVPTQNYYQGQDIGQALHLENQNSYGNYGGVATVLIPSEDQVAVSPQYWSGWQTSYSTGTSTFGIDFTATTPVVTYIVETDLLPTGTILSKDTFTQLEYKLSTAAQSGDSVQLYYRLDSTSAWATCGTTNTESTSLISGYYDMLFQKTQWVQLRVVVTTNGTVTSSFGRLAQVILR